MIPMEERLLHLTPEQIAEIDRYSVESQREKYSDEYLWSKLDKEWEYELMMEFELHKSYRLAHSSRKDRFEWQKRWQLLIDLKKFSRDIFDLAAWHLKMRGDSKIEDWLVEREKERAKWSRDCLDRTYQLYSDDRN